MLDLTLRIHDLKIFWLSNQNVPVMFGPRFIIVFSLVSFLCSFYVALFRFLCSLLCYHLVSLYRHNKFVIDIYKISQAIKSGLALSSLSSLKKLKRKNFFLSSKINSPKDSYYTLSD
ncbi:hypothetical protein KFK09_021337 [Dendrobium nobile]|uniref:Uncharacterized protein n=1 Tax=Dendrobium nobile TaxID=94219 RepID=A0A8T3ANF5_DENNO|nr:hypothetical protein KFK09_021337 [Dendrobium nobile]